MKRRENIGIKDVRYKMEDVGIGCYATVGILSGRSWFLWNGCSCYATEEKKKNILGSDPLLRRTPKDKMLTGQAKDDKDKVKPCRRYVMSGISGSSIEVPGSVDVNDSNASNANNDINENTIN